MAGLDLLCWFAWHPFGGHLGLYRELSKYGLSQFRGDQHVPRFSDLSFITYDYGL